MIWSSCDGTAPGDNPDTPIITQRGRSTNYATFSHPLPKPVARGIESTGRHPHPFDTSVRSLGADTPHTWKGVATEWWPSDFVSQNYETLVALMQEETKKRSSQSLQARLNFGPEDEVSPPRHQKERRGKDNRRPPVFGRIGKKVSGTQTANLQNLDTHENNDWRISVRDRLGSRDVHNRLRQRRSPNESPPSSDSEDSQRKRRRRARLNFGPEDEVSPPRHQKERRGKDNRRPPVFGRIGKKEFRSGTHKGNLLEFGGTHDNNDWRISVRDRLGSHDVHSRLGQRRSPNESPPSSDSEDSRRKRRRRIALMGLEEFTQGIPLTFFTQRRSVPGTPVELARVVIDSSQGSLQAAYGSQNFDELDEKTRSFIQEKPPQRTAGKATTRSEGVVAVGTTSTPHDNDPKEKLASEVQTSQWPTTQCALRRATRGERLLKLTKSQPKFFAWKWHLFSLFHRETKLVDGDFSIEYKCQRVTSSHRMYIDGGASADILYEHCFQRVRPKVKSQLNPATTSLTGFTGEKIWPMGQLRLPVMIGNKEHSTTAWMNFMVIRSPSPYNGIIGRPGISAYWRGPHSYGSDAKIPRRRRRGFIRLPGARKKYRSRGSHSDTGWAAVCALLQRNSISFDGKPKYMMVREGLYHYWLSSPRYGSKGGGKGDRLAGGCALDFTDLNKHVHKTAIHYRRIDWNVESLCGYLSKPDGIKPVQKKQKLSSKLPSTAHGGKEVHRRYNGEVSRFEQVPIQVSRQVTPLVPNAQEVYEEGRLPLDYNSRRSFHAAQAAYSSPSHASRPPVPGEDGLCIYPRRIMGQLAPCYSTDRTPLQTPVVYFVSKALKVRRSNYRANGEADPGFGRNCKSGAWVLPREITSFFRHASAVKGTDTGGFSHRKKPGKNDANSPERSKTPRTMDLIHGWIVCLWTMVRRRPLSSLNRKGMGIHLAELRFEFTATNNEAEYEALIAGLRIAA
ncbi:hypothetical protein Tco_1200899 [Tanacetum coccineum]